MKRLLPLFAAVLLAVSTATAFAADVTGTWSGSMSIPDGSSFPLSFTFKQDGAKLTGSIAGPQGEPLPISDGKVTENTISFTVVYNGMTIKHTGTISGDAIKLSSKSDQGEFPGADFTITRVKAAAPPAPPQL